MKVTVNNNVYEMSKKHLNGILSIAKKKVTFGIYAIQKDDYCELRKDKFDNEKSLKKSVADYQEQGFKVYYNDKKENAHE